MTTLEFRPPARFSDAVLILLRTLESRTRGAVEEFGRATKGERPEHIEIGFSHNGSPLLRVRFGPGFYAHWPLRTDES